ncbi:hypothetical protein HSBAA_25170 [Vreelandella sulfidaeris]|uniref:Uncharacterized protein n=1 Tax=Vreelandella sulfidaeris TaxID=115553 RepID=A0A455U9I5_9GAMM|nr:hypothetical protein HSBAA_25170 [Halomonas sulfidaeris]
METPTTGSTEADSEENEPKTLLSEAKTEPAATDQVSDSQPPVSDSESVTPEAIEPPAGNIVDPAARYR